MNRYRQRSLGGLLATVALIAACGRSDAATRWQATVDTIGDTIVVRTTAGSVWRGPAELVSELSIGELEAEDEYMLGNVQALAVNGNGEIFALDGQVPVLRKYGPDGLHRLDLGRKGGGPGEYNRPDGGLAVLPDGRVLLRDPGNARMNVYSSDGEDLGAWRLPSGGGFNTSRRLYMDTAGNAFTLVLRERGADVVEWRFGLARFSAEGEHTDTLDASRWHYDAPQVVGRKEGSTSVSNVPFSPAVTWTYSPLGYLVGGVSTDYRIDLLHAGPFVLRIEKAWQPVPVSSAEKVDAEERITRNMRNQFPGWRWNGPPVPDTKPPYRSVFAGDDGRIWVLLSQPAVELMSELEAKQELERTQRSPVRFREPVAFDVFEADGRYLGRVTAPDGFATSPEPVFRADQVWAVSRDTLDVPRIVRFRIHHIE